MKTTKPETRTANTSGKPIREGYCDDCPNPAECYLIEKCWPPATFNCETNDERIRAGVFPAPGSGDPTQHPEILARILATLARDAGGEIRLNRIEQRTMMALYHDPATMEYVVRASDVPWLCLED